MPFPFEVPFDQLQTDLDTYVDEVFEALRSEFLTVPKGEGFIEYPVFEQGYQALKRVTEGFRKVAPATVTETVHEVPITLVVLRAMLGFTSTRMGVCNNSAQRRGGSTGCSTHARPNCLL